MRYHNNVVYAITLGLFLLTSAARVLPVTSFNYFSSSETQETTEAVEEETTEETTEETFDEDAATTDSSEDEYVAPIIYGELKDGLFVRTFQEELDSIEGGSDNPHFLEEYGKIIKARSLGALTPEMEAAGGYYLEGDLVVMQADLDAVADEGEAGEGSNVVDSDDVTENYGFVTIIAEVEDIIEENKQTCYVQLFNDETGETFEFDLLAINNYTTTSQRLPAGSYLVAYGGVPGDYTTQFTFNALTETFELQAGGSATVRVQIGDVDGSQAARRAEEEAEKETEEIEVVEEVEEEGTNIVMIAVIAGVIILLVVAVIAFIVKRAKENAWK